MNERRWKIEPGDFVNCNKIRLGKLDISEFDLNAKL
jgi:hypothetical protein